MLKFVGGELGMHISAPEMRAYSSKIFQTRQRSQESSNGPCIGPWHNWKNVVYTWCNKDAVSLTSLLQFDGGAKTTEII